MAQFPALPLWTDSYLADTGHLTDAEHGIYFQLLMLIWRNPECRIPNDDKWLSRRLRRSVEDVQKDVRPIIEEFCRNNGNWITQGRLKDEWDYCKSKSKSQSVRAKSRWNKEKTICQDDAGPHASGICPDDAGPHASGICPLPTPTPTPLESSVNNNSAREAKNADADSKPSGKEEAKNRIEVGNRVLQAAGIDPAKWVGDFSVVSMWLKSEFDVELDIVPTVERVRKRKDSNWSPSSLSYFTKPIADAHQERNQKLPAYLDRQNKTAPLVTKSIEDQLAEVRIPILVRKGYSAEEIVAMKSHEMTEDEFEAVQMKVAVA